MLYLYRHSPELTARLSLLKSLVRKGDAVLFIEDGVIVPATGRAGVPPGIEVYALSEDLLARGFADSACQCVDMKGFVALTAKHGSPVNL